MLNIFARASLSKLVAPLGGALARIGITPDAVTVFGTLGTVGAALGFYARGSFLVGTFVITFFVLLDMVDGAVARAIGTTSRFGAFLDSTMDRVADAAVFGALIWWFAGAGDSEPLALAALLCLVLGSITSYSKARAQSLGLPCDVGFAERAERLIIALVGTGLDGLGVPYIQAVALWFLVAASALTVGQRLVEVHRQARAQIAGPSGTGQMAGQR